MNLIQVQEHLKDMPMRDVMEYANGKNPQVPPYLALGELNRRKQMQQPTAIAPDSSVKERLEKELTGQATDLMQAGAARQAQSNEAMQQGIMAQPQPVPEGTPQPPQPEEEMPQMAGGGLTALPVNNMFKFAEGGGIVAFAAGDAVVDEFSAANPEIYNQQVEQNRLRNEESQRLKSQKELIDKIKFLETAAPEVAERLKRERASELPQAAVAPAQQGIAYDPATATRRSDFPPPRPMAASPAVGIPAGKMPGAPTFKAPDVDAYKTALAEFKKANPGAVGAEFQALMDKISKQDEEDRGKFITQEKRRSQSDFFQSLIDAGEATRGQKGLGSLFAGYGRSSSASQAAADERANAQVKLRREQDLGMAKMRAELEAARRAEARGDFDSAFKHKQEAEKIGLDLQQKQFSNEMDIAKLKEQARGHSIQAATANRPPQLVQVAEDIQRKNPQMSPNEAMERAGSLLASGQYQTSAQRQQTANQTALAKQTDMIDMMINFEPVGTARRKELETQRDKIVERFISTQQILDGKGVAENANTPASGFGQARVK